MKKTDTEWVMCATCRPFKRFDPPNAAAKLDAHYRDVHP